MYLIDFTINSFYDFNNGQGLLIFQSDLTGSIKTGLEAIRW